MFFFFYRDTNTQFYWTNIRFGYWPNALCRINCLSMFHKCTRGGSWSVIPSLMEVVLTWTQQAPSDGLVANTNSSIRLPHVSLFEKYWSLTDFTNLSAPFDGTMTTTHPPQLKRTIKMYILLFVCSSNCSLNNVDRDNFTAVLMWCNPVNRSIILLN